MFARWVDMDSAFSVMDEFRRRMDRMWSDLEGGGGLLEGPGGGSVRGRIEDAGSEFVIVAEVPGLGEKDVDVRLHEDVLTVRGERKADVPEGYRAHRQERLPVRFTRSFSLSSKIDAERVSAVVKDGLLTVRLPKAPESRPRQIEVKGS